jgi:predicted dinucleotide-binding enzyme
MKIGMLGSGNVGQALAKGLVAEGHAVYLATRQPDGAKGTRLKADIPGATVCDFETAAKEAELAVLCTPWAAAADALKLADAQNSLSGKVLIDPNNAVKQRNGSGVELVLGFDASAGETVQSWLPNARVVKCWNIIGADSFYKPQFSATPTMFLCGDDAKAKKRVSDLVQSFGWEPLDAGGIEAARQLEPMAVLWINNAMRTRDRHHAFKML